MGEGGIKVFVGSEYSGSPMKASSKYSQRLASQGSVGDWQWDDNQDGVSVLRVLTI